MNGGTTPRRAYTEPYKHPQAQPYQPQPYTPRAYTPRNFNIPRMQALSQPAQARAGLSPSGGGDGGAARGAGGLLGANTAGQLGRGLGTLGGIGLGLGPLSGYLGKAMDNMAVSAASDAIGPGDPSATDPGGYGAVNGMDAQSDAAGRGGSGDSGGK